MSKNVAVFVDVANIFYAAKAAGIDIDYVTLLKSATANRDFVRAYAYTGLDPENENQRQFHAFLARSGYKVVSKDIRKYGDGRVKANLDIELVVDMMRLAEKLDIAIVVSGDGDFAPAIAAVQQKGVRVEVISFRGNTSSDLMDVADVFIDITTVAKVEKGVRSGRRIASEGDLSMTEVPDKESGVKPRRRRRSESDDKSEKSEKSVRSARTPRRRSGRTAEVAEAETVAKVEVPSAGAAALVALPGEKLSRGAEAAEPRVEVRGAPGRGPRARRWPSPPRSSPARKKAVVVVDGVAVAAVAVAVAAAPSPTTASPAMTSPARRPSPRPRNPTRSPRCRSTQASAPCGIARSASRLTPPRLPHQPRPATASTTRTSRTSPKCPSTCSPRSGRDGAVGRGGRSGRGARTGGGYRSAIDRERYGTGSSFSRSSGRSKGRSDSAPRASAQSMDPIEQTRSGDPWSEVPPEVQELLRAEVARREATEAKAQAPAEEKPKKQTTPQAHDQEAEAEAPAEEAAAEEAPAEEKPKKRTTRKRTTKKPAEAEAPAEEAAAEEAPAEEKPKKQTTRKRTTKKPGPRPRRPRRKLLPRRSPRSGPPASARPRSPWRPRPRRPPTRPSRPWTVPPSRPRPAAPS